jgi:hypothetical protein
LGLTITEKYRLRLDMAAISFGRRQARYAARPSLSWKDQPVGVVASWSNSGLARMPTATSVADPLGTSSMLTQPSDVVPGSRWRRLLDDHLARRLRHPAADRLIRRYSGGVIHPACSRLVGKVGDRSLHILIILGPGAFPGQRPQPFQDPLGPADLVPQSVAGIVQPRLAGLRLTPVQHHRRLAQEKSVTCTSVCRPRKSQLHWDVVPNTDSKPFIGRNDLKAEPPTVESLDG